MKGQVPLNQLIAKQNPAPRQRFSQAGRQLPAGIVASAAPGGGQASTLGGGAFCLSFIGRRGFLTIRGRAFRRAAGGAEIFLQRFT